MSETTVTAVVLRRIDAGESDRRLTLFTREFGKIDAVAKGARKGGSRLAGVSEPLVVAQFHLASGRRQRFVTQAQPVSSLPLVRSDYTRLLCGLAMVELVAVSVPYEAPHLEAFDMLLAALAALGGDSDPVVALVWFSARLMAAEGQLPVWTQCVVTGESIAEAEIWYSASAHGSLSEGASSRFGDRRKATRETMLGISRIAELDAPPPRLKRASECCTVLFRFWQGLLEAPFPAWETAVRSLSEYGE